jgi:hypothetical protein
LQTVDTDILASTATMSAWRRSFSDRNIAGVCVQLCSILLFESQQVVLWKTRSLAFTCRDRIFFWLKIINSVYLPGPQYHISQDWLRASQDSSESYPTVLNASQLHTSHYRSTLRACRLTSQDHSLLSQYTHCSLTKINYLAKKQLLSFCPTALTTITWQHSPNFSVMRYITVLFHNTNFLIYNTYWSQTS